MSDHARTPLVIPLLAGLLALSIAVLPTTPADAVTDVCDHAPAGAFDDVAPGATHAANIDCLAAYGISVGVGGGNYDPAGHVPRGQMASFLVNFLEVARDTQPTVPGTSTFTDVAGTTHRDNILIARALGITTGVTATTYAPNRDVTRAQMATFVVQLLEAAGASFGDAPDAFGDDDGSVHEAQIDTLAAADIVAGVAPGQYDPTGPVSRAQMATFLVNAARHLDGLDLWLAEPLPVDGPAVVLVSRTDLESDDRIDVHLDRDVALLGPADGAVVFDADGGQTVATGLDASVEGDVVRVELDGLLVEGGIHWLRLDAGVVEDGEGIANVEQTVAFTFTAVPGDGGEAGGDGEGDGSGGAGEGAGDEPASLTVASVATEPAMNRIVVRFDDDVTCPGGTVAALAAWDFTNLSIEEDAPQATGHPDSMQQPGGDTDTCWLGYDAGIENGDFGTLTYTQPAGEPDRVASLGGESLATTGAITVVDGIPPVFQTVSATGGQLQLTLGFGEPIACSSLGASDFVVSYDGAPIAVLDPIGCNPPAAKSITVTMASAPAAGAVVVVTIPEGQVVADESGDNRVGTPMTRQAVAAG